MTDLLARLVAFDTTSRESNLPLIDWAQERLERAGATCRRVPNDDGDKAGLLARLGPEREGGVVLSAHTDCVPVDGQPWSSDPFSLAARDGRLFGRGVADMKGFIAVCLAVVDRIDTADLTVPVFLALSYDEEVGTVGAGPLARALVDHEPRPALVLVGEPTSMDVVVAHKGVRQFRTTVTGVDAHSSQPHLAANAVAAAARVAAFIDDLADERRSAAGHEDFDPPYTTFNTARIEGGTAINIVPRRAVLEWEYRPVPADDGVGLREQVDGFVEDEILPRLRRDVEGAGVETVDGPVTPTLEPHSGAARFLGSLLPHDRPARTVAYGTDGGHFQRHGLPTVVCGPGSIDQAHTADEWLDPAQLEASRGLLERLVQRLEDPAPLDVGEE